MNERWEVSTKGNGTDGRGFEVCAELTPHTNSWGWFGPTKIRIEGMRFEEAKTRAQAICDGLNAAAGETRDHAAEVHRLNNELTKLTLENQALKRDIARVLAALAEYMAPEIGQ
jgi:hypothetical protein